MKYVFSANKIPELQDNAKCLKAHISLAAEAIQRASELGPTEFYCNPGLALETIRLVVPETKCVELPEFDHGNFWPWAKFKALRIAAQGMNSEGIAHLDLDTMLYDNLDRFLSDAEMIVAGIELFDCISHQAENEHIYSNLGGRDVTTHQGKPNTFYLEGHEAISPGFPLHGRAYNCCVLGGRASRVIEFCDLIESRKDFYHKSFFNPNPARHGFPGAAVESWKTSCVLEQCAVVDFCISQNIGVAVLPLSPAPWTSRTQSTRMAFAGDFKGDGGAVNLGPLQENLVPGFVFKNIRPLGSPTHHHLTARTSPLIKKEIKIRCR